MAYWFVFLLLIFTQSAYCVDTAVPAPLIEHNAQLSGQEIQLTEEEKQWLAGHNNIHIAYDGSLPPYSFVNDEGKIDGVAVEIMNILSQRLGIKFTIFPDYNWANLYKAAAKRKVDAVATMVSRSDREGWFTFTKPYLTKSLVIVTKPDNTSINNRSDLENKTVAVVKGYQYADQILTEFPSVKLTRVDSMLAGLQSVENGQADAAIIFLGTVNYLQSKYALNNLRIAAFYDRNNANESIAIRKDWPILAQVLQKGLDSLTEEEVQQIFAKWVVGGGLPVAETAAQNPVQTPPVAPVSQESTGKPKVTSAPEVAPEGPKTSPTQLQKEKVNIGNLVVIVSVVAALFLLWAALIRKQKNFQPKNKNEMMTSVRNLQSEHNDGMHLTIEPDSRVKDESAELETETPPSLDLPLSEDITYHQDCEGRMSFVSANITSLLGYSVNDFMVNFRSYLTDNPVNRIIDEQIEKSVIGQPTEPYEIEIFDAGQDVHWLEITDTPIYNGQGHCIGVDGVMRDITDHKLYEKVAIKAANQESSEIANVSQSLHVQIKESILAAAHNQQSFILIYIALDRLRTLDGQLYESDQAEVLDESTRRLKATLRDTDKIIQFDTGKYALILPDTDNEMVSLVIEKIRKILQVPYLIGVSSIVLDVNIGLAVYPKNGSDPVSLLNEAQVLLPAHELDFPATANKDKNRNLDDESETLELQQGLLAALDECKLSLRASSKQNINALQRHSQLSIYYQSRHNLGDYSIAGFEALVRWRHPHRGLLLPLDFVPLIKGIGLLDIMTYWILQQVCFQAVAWESLGIRPPLLTVNLSGIGVKKTLDPDKIIEIIKETGAQPEWLALSIPENEIVHHPDSVLPIIKQLSGEGLLVSVDNFGNDPHFLSLLESMPAQLIEVDPYFVRDVTDNYTNPEIINHTVAMLKEQGRTVIIKEVETETQLDFLRTTGCDMVQGYLLSRAVPPGEAKELMETFPDVAWYFQQK